MKTFDIALSLSKAQAKSIFLKFLPDVSVRPEGFEPVFSIEPEKVYASTNLLFVINEGSDTLSFVDRVNGELIDTLAVGKRPKALCAGRLADRHVLYVVNSGANSISIIDPEKRRVENEIFLKRGVEPVSIASGRLRDGRELLFVANFRSNNISVVDPLTLQEMGTLPAGNGPVKVIVDVPVESVFESPFLGSREREELLRFRERFFNIYVANYYSNSLSIIRIDAFTGRMEDRRDIKVGWNPVNMYIDSLRQRLYVANYGSDYISVIEIPELFRGELRSKVINNTGRQIRDLFMDSEFNRLYLLRETGEISIIRLSSDLMESEMPVILNSIFTGGMPVDFLVSLRDGRIYVVDRQRGVLSIFDRLRQRLISEVQTGKEPAQIIELTNFP